MSHFWAAAAAAAAAEIGHAMGLSHDGQMQFDIDGTRIDDLTYYDGHSSEFGSWAPVSTQAQPPTHLAAHATHTVLEGGSLRT
jgi:hypothetical protein